MEIMTVKSTSREELYVEMDTKIELIKELEQRVRLFLTPCIEEIEEVLIGLHEMVVNAIEHGNKFDPAKKVSVYVSTEKDQIGIVIGDEGDGFEWGKKIGRPLNMDGFEERGRGIALTSLCFNSILYNMPGNKVFLIKKRDKY